MSQTLQSGAVKPTNPAHQDPGLFIQRMLSDVSTGYVCLAGAIGDRLGLFKALAAVGPATPNTLADAAGVDARYAQEWLHLMLAADYVSRDENGAFTLPPGPAAVLADEGGPAFFASTFVQLAHLVGMYERLVEAAAHGDGIPGDEYPAAFYDAMDRTLGTFIDHQLVQPWVPAVDGLAARLVAGATMADVGSGGGRALVRLAQAYPKSQFTGIDVSANAVRRAQQRAASHGVRDRVQFHRVDAADGLPGRYDAVLLSDTLHDVADPVAVLSGIRRALNPDGVLILVELNANPDPIQDKGPWGQLLSGGSLAYCLNVGIADGGPGIGSAGMPEPEVRRLCTLAGFSHVEKALTGDPYNNLFVVRVEA